MSPKGKAVLRVLVGMLGVCVVSVLATYVALRPARAIGPGPQQDTVPEPGSEVAPPPPASIVCDGNVFRCVCGPSGASLEVLMATLAVSPEITSPGQTIQVAGEGFAPGSSVALRLGVPNAGLSRKNLATVVADANGAFGVELTVPTEWPGAQTPIVERELVIAAVDETQGQTLAFAQFTNEAN